MCSLLIKLTHIEFLNDFHNLMKALEVFFCAVLFYILCEQFQFSCIQFAVLVRQLLSQRRDKQMDCFGVAAKLFLFNIALGLQSVYIAAGGAFGAIPLFRDFANTDAGTLCNQGKGVHLYHVQNDAGTVVMGVFI